MGQLMSARKCGGGSGDLGADALLLDLFPPSASDPAALSSDPEGARLHASMAELLQESVFCVRAVREYKENTELLRAAMVAPKDDALQVQAFASLLPSIANIKRAYDLSTRLADELPHLLLYLVARRTNLREHPALLKQLADVLEFSLAFDFEKMGRPALQNDFSYYRRYLGRMAPLMPGGGVAVQEAEAGIISLYMAQTLPMTITVEKALKSVDKAPRGGGAEGVCQAVQLVGLLANVTCDLALRPGVDDELRRYALRVMTSSVVIYDRVSETGVFTRLSPVRTRKCLRTLRKEQEGTATESMSSSAPLAKQLLNSVKYSTLHLKDGSTPGYIRTLLSD